ncbi:MAG: 50S ribosomal protein L22 [Candidatus Altiarchaeales archaeon]|nr:50S ribosomal protein L22 [Candidatus Altiarchaeales archaeon]
MKINYSKKEVDGSTSVSAQGRDMNISFKDAVVLSDFLRGKTLSSALKQLDAVVEKKLPVPYRRFNTGIGHRKGGQAKVGKYPVKAAQHFKDVLRNLEGNAEYKGLEAEDLKIIHIQALKGRAILKRKPKGRWKPWSTQYVNIQVIAQEQT